MNKPTFKHICLMHIQQLTNFPYIEKDFDALTDYGLLCKVVDYLNQVIASENAQNENILALYNAFTELKNYVENYFDNLDVQDEINNKLDEMASSGQLEQIIEQYLNSSAIWGFDTVADMKNATNLINGSFAKTLGYYAANDGGSATYKIRTITNEDIVDEMFIIALSNGDLVAELVIETPLVIEQIGAKGDGTTDDTSIIQAGLDKTNNIILNKNYKITDSIIISSNQIFNLKGTINYTGINSAIEVQGSRNIIDINKLYSSGYGITLNCSSALEANRVNIEYINSTKHCIQLLSSSGGNVYNEIRFTTLISTVGYYCIYLYAGSGAYVGENTFYGGKCQRGTWAVYADSDHAGGIPVVKLYNFCFEGVKNGVYLNNAQASTINYPRYAELLQVENSILLSVNGDSKDTIFNGNHPITSDRLAYNITSPAVTSNRPIIINAPIMNSDGNTIGIKAWITNIGLSIFPPEIRRVNVTQSKDGTTISKNEYQYAWFHVNYDATMKLNESYIPQVINEIYIYYDGTKRLILKDYLDNTIHDGTGLSTGIYKIKSYKDGTTLKYITEKVNTVS